MGFFYEVFGLKLQSDREIPGLVLSAPAPEVDIRVFWGSDRFVSPREARAQRDLIFESSTKSDAGEAALRIWRSPGSEDMELDYADGVKFRVDKSGRNVWAAWPETSSLEDAATYFLGPIFGLILRLRGFACLHASAVRIGNYAVAFVGSEGAGKSTTAAAFAKQGYSVISDDIVAIRADASDFVVLPAYPYLSLWQDSVEMLYGSAAELPSFSRAFEKKMVKSGARAVVFEPAPTPLGAIAILGERTSSAAGPYLESLTGKEALVRLVANSYAVHLVGKEAQAAEFSTFGELASSLPIALLHVHTDPARLPELVHSVSALLA